MAHDWVAVRGARVHNLKNIDVDLPRDQLVVITGLSGSGKSSLAFDTIYAEGQRRYVESLSSYARQFLEQMEKPDVDLIDGLSPAIAIEQKTTGSNPRSTVGTVTEIYDYLRLLFANIGVPHCHLCGREIASQSLERIIDMVMLSPNDERVNVLAPVVRGRKGEFKKELAALRARGFTRVRVDGQLRSFDEDIKLDRRRNHNIEVVVDRLVLKPGIERRITESVEVALNLADDIVVINTLDGGDRLFSRRLACTYCGVSMPEMTPRAFSFNSPHGACTDCQGLGAVYDFDPARLVPDESLSLNDGAIAPWAKGDRKLVKEALTSLSRHFGIDLALPFKRLTKKTRDLLFYGTGSGRREGKDPFGAGFEGLIPNLRRRYEEGTWVEQEGLEAYRALRPCPACQGARLKPQSRAVRVKGRTVTEYVNLPISEALHVFESLDLTDRENLIASRILREIRDRLRFLNDVGVGYLTLGRSAATLSGGEGQRIRLATQIGSNLTGVLYVLDEPSIGLHQRDNRALLATLARLRDLGNTVVVVEHDEETIRTADYVIDLGPGAGEHGGHVIFQGKPAELLNNGHGSLTGAYLRREKAIADSRDEAFDQPRIHRHQGRAREQPEGHRRRVSAGRPDHRDRRQRLGQVDARERDSLPGARADAVSGGRRAWVAHVDGRHRPDRQGDPDRPVAHRADAALEPGDLHRACSRSFESCSRCSPESRARGFRPGRFSFNVKGGRCETCQGDGVIAIEMHFLPNVYVTCEQCKGRRYNRETLDIKYRGKSIADVLDLTVDQALPLLENFPPIANKLRTLQDVGLGYIELGQSATTLSGGEAQRVKLAKELSRRGTGRTLYILDEPTTGLHFADTHKLLDVLNKLVDQGNTVVIIEHNLDVIKSADYVIDLGPEGGAAGGRIVAQGTPETVATSRESFTGRFLAEILGPHAA